jgi:hypothetical protein
LWRLLCFAAFRLRPASLGWMLRRVGLAEVVVVEKGFAARRYPSPREYMADQVVVPRVEVRRESELMVGARSCMAVSGWVGKRVR